jgi:outer membrane biosynthesis protein TonB
MGLDQKAVEAVTSWRFTPAEKDGEPVAVEMAAEVNFHL